MCRRRSHAGLYLVKLRFLGRPSLTRRDALSAILFPVRDETTLLRLKELPNPRETHQLFGPSNSVRRPQFFLRHIVQIIRLLG